MIDWDAETRKIVQHYVDMARKEWAVDQARDSVSRLQREHGCLWKDLGEKVKERLERE